MGQEIIIIRSGALGYSTFNLLTCWLVDLLTCWLERVDAKILGHEWVIPWNPYKANFWSKTYGSPYRMLYFSDQRIYQLVLFFSKAWEILSTNSHEFLKPCWLMFRVLCWLLRSHVFSLRILWEFEKHGTISRSAQIKYPESKASNVVWHLAACLKSHERLKRIVAIVSAG